MINNLKKHTEHKNEYKEDGEPDFEVNSGEQDYCKGKSCNWDLALILCVAFDFFYKEKWGIA